MTAELMGENAGETVRAGFVDLSVEQTWEVITLGRAVPFTTVLQDVDLPALGSAQVFDTQTLWCISRIPKRVDTDKTGRKWIVACNWSNNTGQFSRDKNGVPVTDPTLAVKSVDIQFLEYGEPIIDATFRDETEGGGHTVGTVITGTPSWFTLNPTGAVRVSTGEAVFAERIAYRQIITVSRIEKVWTANYETFTNALNDAQVVITEDDSTGTIATYTYEPLTLRMKPITKQPIWQDAKMYFRIVFEMEHNATTWIHSESDRSQTYRAFVGQNYADGTTWTQADLDKVTDGGDYAIQSIKTKDQNGKETSVGDPVKLNGYGERQPYPRVSGTVDPDGDVYLNYDVYPIKDYSVLGL